MEMDKEGKWLFQPLQFGCAIDLENEPMLFFGNLDPFSRNAIREGAFR
jgi:hypothetical protein